MAKCRDCDNEYEYDRELDCPVCNECLNRMIDEVENEIKNRQDAEMQAVFERGDE